MAIFWILIASELLYASSLAKRVQIYLSLSGYNIGKADGIVGLKTRQGLSKAYEGMKIDKDYVVSTQDISNLRNIYFQKKSEIWNKIPHLSQRLGIADARHLLERTGIGAHYLDVQRFAQLTRAQAINEILSNFNNFPVTPLPKFIYEDLPPYWIRWDYDEPGQQDFRVARDSEMSQFRQWWVKEMIATAYPQNDRLVLFWTNHFPVEYSAISEQSISIARQHLMFRAYGFENFKSLIKQIIRDPAMLNYLDAEDSRKGAPNENLGRELMELFVLGEGAYDEKTVKEASRALTGYKYNRLRNFEFRKTDWSHDKNRKVLFGQKGNFDGDDLIDILFQQPQAATFLTKKFWNYYISEVYEDKSEMERIALEFKKSDFEIPILLSEILVSESFWNIKHRGTIVKSPIDLVIGSIRSTGFLPSDWQRIPGVLSSLGQNLFEPPNVAGWPGGASWITPAALLNRSRYLYGLFNKEGVGLADLEQENPEIMMTRPNNIILRYGAENFQGPPRFKIMLIQNEENPYKNETVWVSPVISAKAGHDTELFGRIEGDEIPWNLATFDFDPTTKFNKVSVHFINDHCCGPGGSDGGDRNFFVEWVKVGKHLFLAKDGRQRSNCPNNNEKPGFLYCSGNVLMEKSNSVNIQDVELEDIQIKEDQLVVERVAFKWGENYDRNDNWNEINIALLNVRFNSHSENGIILKIVHNPKHDFKIVLSSDNCSNICFSGNWPKSAFKWNNGIKALEFSIGPNEDSKQRRQFQQLSKEDQKFIAALWNSIPTLLQKMQEGQNFKSRDGKKILTSWDKVLKKMFNRLEKSRYVKDYDFPPLLIALDPNKKSEGMMSMAMSALNLDVPIPAAQSLNKTDKEWNEALISSVGTQNIQAAILANDPIGQLSTKGSTKEILSNPVFHLK